MILEESAKKLTDQALKIIEICRASQMQRSAVYRVYGQWRETGRAAGPLALGNVLYAHLQRTASHLMSPTDLRYEIDFEEHYGQDWLDKAAMAARALTREWERKRIGLIFSRGVYEGLSYGACLQKNLSRQVEGHHEVKAKLVMPWQFAVFDESRNDLDEQEAFVETVWLNKYEVWRRVQTLPDAKTLYERIMASATKETGATIPTSFMHQVLSTAVLNTSLQNATQPMPGGIVQLSNDPNYATLGPTVAAELFPMHELWVRDDERGDDLTTIQIIEPDILIAPLYKRINLYAPETNPYTLIQPNEVTDYFWGRSEIVDLQMLQEWLTTHLDDIKRISGQEADRILGFPGHDGLTDQIYAAMRSAGFVSTPPGASVVDLTPHLPAEALNLIDKILFLMDRVSGFANILSGSGEPGVRAGVHADTLMRTASPHLRDRSLLTEAQCAAAGDSTLSAMEAKDAKVYWAKEDDSGAIVETGDFLLSSLPDDRRVAVDAHSTSPIYHDDQQNLIAFGIKAGFVTGDSAIEDLPYQHKDKLLSRFHAKEKAQQQMLQNLPPEERAKVLGHAGGRHR